MNLYYNIDESGSITADNKGKQVISCMRELGYVYFSDDIILDWRRQPEEGSIDVLHMEFPNPPDCQFNIDWMKSAMKQALKSRRGLARTTERSGDRKPPGLSADDRRRVADERRTFPNRWDQQREANRVQQSTIGISRFGSEGKANFLYKFVSTLKIWCCVMLLPIWNACQ